MCDRECICKSCVNNCSLCPSSEEKISECRNGGVKECECYDPIIKNNMKEGK